MQRTKPKQQELLELGKKLQQFYEMGYVNKKQAVTFSFLKGMASGFGVFLGGTILIALLVWLLSFFKELPLIRQVVDTFRQTVTK